MAKPIVVAAGGTGGHLFPAQALAAELKRRGHPVELISDDRVAPFAGTFPADRIHVIRSGTVTGQGVFGKIKGLIGLGRGVLAAARVLKGINPAIVVGFGGYPTVPPLLSAIRLKIPTALHEQNAVMGRANRFLAGKVQLVATGFPLSDANLQSRLVQVGNPVRDTVLAVAGRAYPAVHSDARIQICIFGGSQGARVMSDIVPPAIAALPDALRTRIRVVQQAREEDKARVVTAYAEAGVSALVESFFTDMPEHIAASHLVIARGGASTIAELSVIGRPAILVPLPGALDQDQRANANMLETAGGAKTVIQTAFTPDWLSTLLAEWLGDLPMLATRAAAAKATGMPDAASRLADSVLKHARF
jgi:UDP-N-acetylglucosamine--N-acetylmuramyl-(pentapeptide) pyrophosphoryl-undecaprenol N-acetylglucosamine transferase